MLWPLLTPEIVHLPRVKREDEKKESSSLPGPDTADSEQGLLDGTTGENDELQEKILSVKSIRHGRHLLVLTQSHLYVYQVRPLAVVCAYKRSEKCLKQHGVSTDLFVSPDSHLAVVQTSKNYVISFSISVPSDEEAEPMYQPYFPGGFGYRKSLNGLTSDGDINLSNSYMDDYSELHYELFFMDVVIQLELVVHIDGEIQKLVPLESFLMIVTKVVHAIQLIPWFKLQRNEEMLRHYGQNKTHKVVVSSTLLKHMDWWDLTDDKEHIVDIDYCRPMGLSSWVSSAGQCWLVLMRIGKESKTAEEEGEDKSNVNASYTGFKYYAPSDDDTRPRALCSSVNARFSLIALGLVTGKVLLLNIKDYSGTVKEIKSLEPPQHNAGPVVSLSWSVDGNGLVVGYTNGWALYSVFGNLNASSFRLPNTSSTPPANSMFFNALPIIEWSFHGDTILAVSADREHLLISKLLRWSLNGNFSQDNIYRPCLFREDHVMVYKGHEQSDLMTIDHDSLLWQNVKIDSMYYNSEYPIRSVCCSSDGKYIAVAGVHGFAHYNMLTDGWNIHSVQDQRSLFTAEASALFYVRGGMYWYHGFFICGVTTASGTHEVRVYYKDFELRNGNEFWIRKFPSSIVYLTVEESMLLVYTMDNKLYQFDIRVDHRVVPNLDLNVGITFRLIQQTDLHGIVSSPARVRSFSWLLKPEEHGRYVITETQLLLLVDGVLVLLQPDESSGKFTRTTIHETVEYYTCSRNSSFGVTLTCFDGSNAVMFNFPKSMWNSKVMLSLPQPITLDPIDFYPLSVLANKGILMGVEVDVSHKPEYPMAIWKEFTRSNVFLHLIIKQQLLESDGASAPLITKEYRRLKYFPYILELLLYSILVEEQADGSKGNKKLLPLAVEMLRQTPYYLDVIAECTRKIEVDYWKVLFQYTGSVRALFEECLSKNKLKTAVSYLVIIHSFDHGMEDSEQSHKAKGNTTDESNTEERELLSQTAEDLIRVMRLAIDSEEYELCGDLMRFCKNLDQSPNGDLLKRVTEAIQ